MQRITCGLCKEGFPADHEPLTDLDVDRQPIQHLYPCMDVWHLRCIAKELKRLEGACPSCNTSSITYEDLSGAQRPGKQSSSDPQPLSRAQIHRIEGIWPRIAANGYVQHAWAPLSALNDAIEHHAPGLERLIGERIAVLWPGVESDFASDRDLYTDFACCFVKACAQPDIFALFFEQMDGLPDGFTVPFFNFALKQSIIANQPEIFNCLTKSQQFSSSGICSALEEAIRSNLDNQRMLEIVKVLTSIPTKLIAGDFRKVLDLLIQGEQISDRSSQILTVLVESGKIPEGWRLQRIIDCAGKAQNQLLNILSMPGIPENELEWALVRVLQEKRAICQDTVPLLMSRGTLSTAGRSRVFTLSLVGSQKYHREITLLLARSGPFDHLYMVQGVIEASKKGDFTLLKNLIQPDVLKNVIKRDVEEFYWGEALKSAADVGQKAIVILLCQEQKCSAPGILATIILVCSRRRHEHRRRDLEILVSLLQYLPHTTRLSAQVLCEASKRQDPDLLNELFAFRRKYPDRWAALTPEERDLILQNALSPEPAKALEASDEALWILLCEEGANIPPAVRGDAVIRAAEKGMLEKLTILLTDDYFLMPEITLHVLSQAIAKAVESRRAQIVDLLLREAQKRRLPPIEAGLTGLALKLFVLSEGYQDSIKEFLRPPAQGVESLSRYWEKLLKPALETAISTGDLQMVQLLLEYGEISTRMKRQLISEAQNKDPFTLTLLRKKAAIHQSKREVVKLFFIDFWRVLSSCLRKLCWWR